MDFTQLIQHAGKPGLYEKGTASMWDDSYVSTQLLVSHLQADNDLASRKPSTIAKTIDWVFASHPNKGKLKVLDLGCGPGLYAETIARAGHDVCGIDISASSINYAMKSARAQNLKIDYLQKNYLEIVAEEEYYDLVLLIYCDFGMLLPAERITLLKTIYQTLKSGGVFVFDFYSDSNLEMKVPHKNWEAAEYGFWSEKPYLALSESYLFTEPKVILTQHLITKQQNEPEIYRFWTHFFSENEISEILIHAGFDRLIFRNDILPASSCWDGENVFFTMAEKKTNN